MPLVIHDTLAREKRPFVPQDPSRVTLYVCGPTVYDQAHIGNARPPVVFDVLRRVLNHTYGAENVVYARNVTDVDDKINKKAFDEGVSISEITQRYEAIYLQDMATLNVEPPTLAPHVTEHMEAIVKQIADIMARGHAYAAEGHVLFDVASFPEYGQLSGRALEDMIAGARVEVAPYKKNPADFVLWKPSKENEPVWPSPWGPGRPGWHIECSAMIEATLGMPIDIHGGGQDLIFPHHENEVAQGRCAHGGEVYARYWMHNGFLTMGSDKMSKSIGNTVKVHELIDQWPGEVIRWALLSAHYRAPLSWTDELLEASQTAWRRIGRIVLKAKAQLKRAKSIIDPPHCSVLDFLNDDLNTPAALSHLRMLGKEYELASRVRSRAAPSIARDLVDSADLLGFSFIGHTTESAPKTRAKVKKLLAGRAAAKENKNWREADRIREVLTREWLEVKDTPKGPDVVSQLTSARVEELAYSAFSRSGWSPTTFPQKGHPDFEITLGSRTYIVEVKRIVPPANALVVMAARYLTQLGAQRFMLVVPATDANRQALRRLRPTMEQFGISNATFDAFGEISSLTLNEGIESLV